jgi:adenylyl-sulfate kinase
MWASEEQSISSAQGNAAIADSGATVRQDEAVLANGNMGFADTGAAFAVPDTDRVSQRQARRAPRDVAGHAPNLYWHYGQVSSASRASRFGYRPTTVWLTGLSGAGKSTLAFELEQTLAAEGRPSFVLDGDNIRHHLNRDLGFSAQDRKENIRRTAEVARLMNEAGLTVITAFISPYREDRAMAAAIIGEEAFVEVYLNTPTQVCEARDPKGLYAKARCGLIPEFTGVSSPYEEPLNPALVLDTGALAPDLAAGALYRLLAGRL